MSYQHIYTVHQHNTSSLLFTPPTPFHQHTHSIVAPGDLDMTSMRLRMEYLEKELQDTREAHEMQLEGLSEDVTSYHHTISALHAQIASLHATTAEATAVSAASLDHQAHHDAEASSLSREIVTLQGELKSQQSAATARATFLEGEVNRMQFNIQMLQNDIAQMMRDRTNEKVPHSPHESRNLCHCSHPVHRPP